MKAINVRLKELIAARGLSVYKLAKIAGIDNRGLSRFIQGERNLEYDTMIKLMKALGYRVAMVKSGTSAAARIDASVIKKDDIIDIGKLTPKLKA